MEPIDKRADLLEKLVGKVDKLEGKLSWQKDRIARLVTTLDRVVDRLAKFEAQQKAIQTTQKAAERPKTPKTTADVQQVLDTIRYYCALAETTGQMIQIIAGGLALIIDAIQKGKNPFPNTSKGRAAAGDELDLTNLLQAADGLIRGLTATDSTNKESSPAESTEKRK